jgi:hypothetical protein
MKQFLPFTLVFIVGIAQSQAPSCDKPYRIGHFVQLPYEDLRIDRTRAITPKENKEWSKKQSQAQAACDALVSKHPNQTVSQEFSFTVKGFVTVRERCDSFCGTGEELMQLYQKEIGAH